MTRTTTATVRLTPDEHDRILQRAIDNYESVSEYLRRLALTEAAEAAERKATP